MNLKLHNINFHFIARNTKSCSTTVCSRLGRSKEHSYEGSETATYHRACVSLFIKFGIWSA